MADRFDAIDHIIDLHGHIIGMSLSPDHRYIILRILLFIINHYCGLLRLMYTFPDIYTSMSDPGHKVVR